jgi:hypothetical protein
LSRRSLVYGRIAFGALLLIGPEAALRPLARRRVTVPERAVARVLGVRNLAEGAVLARHAGRRWVLAGAAVDATHCLSMIAVAAASPKRRRLALASALIAATTAATGLFASTQLYDPPSGSPAHVRSDLHGPWLGS